MASKFVLVCTSTLDGNSTAAEMAAAVAGSPYTTGSGAVEAIRAISTFIDKQIIGSGISIDYTDTAVSATGTGTFAGGAATADQTMTIAGVTFTAKASPDESANQYLVSADVSLAAASLSRAINASTSLTGIMTATSNAGVVTMTAAVPGTIGNGISTIDVDTSNFTFAQANLTSGTAAHRATYSSGV